MISFPLSPRVRRCERLLVQLPLCAGLLLLAACSSSDGLSTVRGTVAVDGSPLDEGTIHFQATDAASRASAGGVVSSGEFTLSLKDGLAPGQYLVSITGAKKTGRRVPDPQRGEVDELAPLVVSNSPRTIELSADNADQLELQYTTKAAR